MATSFTPLNPLERSLQEAQAGRAPIDVFLREFAAAEIAIPSGGEVTADGSGFRPVLFDKEGVPMVACFTSLDRVAATRKLAPYAMTMKGVEFLRRLPPGHGVVVNPGESVGFDITADGVRRIAGEFA